MAGAARMAAEAAARCGAGLGQRRDPSAHAGLQAAARPELMFHGVETLTNLRRCWIGRRSSPSDRDSGRSDWGRAMLHAALASDKPLVIDADGLNLLAIEPTFRDHWILTPHSRRSRPVAENDPGSSRGRPFRRR
jgi:NAD(P)H-hydrate repair Nnr-like enzyme with NAD(P)H-hydrate dehydratase domain